MNVQESGIYSYLYKVAQNPSRLGPDPDEQILEFSSNIQPMLMTNFKAMFIILITIESSMIIILLMEKCLRLFNN